MVRRRNPVADFDEQLWPINYGIATLGGLLAGFILAKSSLDDPRLTCNGWVGLAGVGLLTGVLLAGASWLRGRMGRRLQLGIVVSLLVHAGALLLLACGEVGQPGRSLAAQQSGLPDEQSLPERFRWQDVDTAAEEKPIYAQPVETEVAENPAPVAVENPQPVGQPPAAGKEPGEPEPADGPPLVVQGLARAELTAPRRAEAAAAEQLSRQHRQHPLLGEAIALPEIKAGDGEGDAGLHAHVAALQRRQTAVATPARRPVAEPAAKPPRAAVQLVLQASPSSPGRDAPAPEGEHGYAGELVAGGGGSPIARAANSSAAGAAVDTTAEGEATPSGGPAGAALVAGSGAGPAGLGGAAGREAFARRPAASPGRPARQVQRPAAARRRRDRRSASGRRPASWPGRGECRGARATVGPAARQLGDGRLGKTDSPGLLGGLGDAVRAQPAGGGAAATVAGPAGRRRGPGGRLGRGRTAAPGRRPAGTQCVRTRRGWRRGAGGGGGDDFPPRLGVPGRFGRGRRARSSPRPRRGFSRPTAAADWPGTAAARQSTAR